MVYLVGVLQYCHTKGEQAGKKFLTLQKAFSNIYRKGNPAKRVIGLVRSELEGIETMTIWEVTGVITSIFNIIRSNFFLDEVSV